jgi:hypothetical protein
MVFLGIIDTSFPSATSNVTANTSKAAGSTVTPSASMQDLAPNRRPSPARSTASANSATNNYLHKIKVKSNHQKTLEHHHHVSSGGSVGGRSSSRQRQRNKDEEREDSPEAEGVGDEAPKDTTNATEEEPQEQEEEQETLEERDFDKDPTVLFTLLQKKEWEQAMERAATHNMEVNVWVSRKEKTGALRWKLLPIHASVVFKAPPSVVDKLLDIFRYGAQIKDDQGMLPLHLAFRNGSTPDIVELLLTAFPESIQAKDRKGRIPLVLAQASTAPHKVAYIEALGKGPVHYTRMAAEKDKATIKAEQLAMYTAMLERMQQEYEEVLEQTKLDAAEILEQTKLEAAQILEQTKLDAEEALEENRLEAEQALEEHRLKAEDERRWMQAQMSQLKKEHEEALDQQIKHAQKEKEEMQAKIDDLEQILAESQESSQVLIAHVNSLEAQMTARMEAERSLSDKVATMEMHMNLTDEEKNLIEAQLTLENAALTASKDSIQKQLEATLLIVERKEAELMEKVMFIQNAQEEWTQTKAELENQVKVLQADGGTLTASKDAIQKQLEATLAILEHKEAAWLKKDKILQSAQDEWTQTKTELENQVKVLQVDWATAQANSAILDAQLKKKMDSEHALATQVSVLASSLAESNQGSRDKSGKYHDRIQELEDERNTLKATVKDLTQRLTTVAKVLQDMSAEQARMVRTSKAQEALIGNAIAQHAEIIGQIQVSTRAVQIAQAEHDAMKRQLEAQEQAIVENAVRQDGVMQAIAVQSETIARTQMARDELISGITLIGKDVQNVLDSITSYTKEEVASTEKCDPDGLKTDKSI